MTLTSAQRAAMVAKAEHQLQPGETVIAVTIAALHVPDKRRVDRTRARAVSLLVSDRRILLYRNRWRGYDADSLRYDQIEAVDHSTGAKLGNLRLGVRGRGLVRLTSVPSDDVDIVAGLIRDRVPGLSSPG